MSSAAFLIIHKDHQIDLAGVNSGAETATLWLARTLARMGSRTILAAQFKNYQSSWNGIECWNLGECYDLSSVIEKAQDLPDFNLLCACRVLPAILAKRLSNCRKKILMAHDPSASALGIKPALLHNFVDHVICVSKAQQDLFLKDGASADLFHVIPNGADLNMFHPQAGITRDPFRIVFAGALVIDKGIDLLIHAFQLVKARIPQAKLDIYGSSQMWGREPLFDSVAIESALPGLKFHGGVSQGEVAKAFSGAALAAIPSRWFDSFPLTAVEAQACGAPVIAFDVGGVKEAFVPGETGILVSNVSEQDLATGILSVLGDSVAISKMSEAAQELVQTRFTWENVVSSLLEICADSEADTVPSKVGLLSTWNQRCGLATYAKFLFGPILENIQVIFSERDVETTTVDEGKVVRCWSREDSNFSQLISSIRESAINTLHVNLHSASFFRNTSTFVEALAELKSSKIAIILQLHSTFTASQEFRALLRLADRVIVHSEQNRLQVIANGGRSDSVEVITHGVEIFKTTEDSRSQLRSVLNMPSDDPVLLAFGFIQPHKGMEGVIEAVYHCRSKGINLHGWIVGSPNESDPGSKLYAEQLVALAERLGVTQFINFVSEFVPDSVVQKYLAASDLVLMNYRSQHYEASGACSLAVGAGAVVLTSMAPPFLAFKDAVWHVTSGYPVHLSVELLLSNPDLREQLRDSAQKFAQSHSWDKTSQKLLGIYRKIITEGSRPQDSDHGNSPRAATSKNVLSVLIQSRPNTFTQRGGDTIVLERTVDSLKSLGVNVVVDVESREDPSKFDLVHLFNFALPTLLREQAERAANCGKPFVVTTLHEDVGRFHAQSHALAFILMEYIKSGQLSEWWDRAKDLWRTVPPVEGFDNEWVCRHAAALLTNGSNESASIQTRYPFATQCEVVSLGSEVGVDVGPELFTETYGVKDFILCVGRLETRKNQLMILKAFENSDIPIVFASGGFTYQPDYYEAVKNFKRKGRTLLLDRLSPEMLASAYAACAVHVLPSWYELPGLVSLEAARRGKPVVVTDYGTARDYLGDCAFYCEPADELSIRNAVQQAFNSSGNERLKAVASSFTWGTIGEQTLKVYKHILGMKDSQDIHEEGVRMAPNNQSSSTGMTECSSSQVVSYDFAPDVTVFQELVEKGETAARAGELAKAKELLAEAEKLDPRSVRVLKVLGTVALAESDIKSAKGYFDRAWSIDPKDPRVLCGLGMCELRAERAVDAYRYFVEALSLSPDSEVAILHFIPCAYALERFDDLERHLRIFVEGNPDNKEMKYCLAGCLVKMKRFDDAIKIGNELVQSDSSSARYSELVEIALKRKSENASPVPTSQMSESAPHSDSGSQRSLIARAIERISIPENSAPAVTSESSNLDLEIGTLEDLKHKRQFSEVVEVADRLLRDSSLSPSQRRTVACLRAEVAVLEGEFELGTRMFNQVLESDPKHARAICGIAVVAANENKWSEARELFERAAQYDPRSDVARAGLGLCAWQSGQNNEAWNHFSAAIQMNPENTRALLGMVQIGFPAKRFAEIEQAIRAYLEFHPADIDWLYSLAGCCYAQEKLEEAFDAVNQITLFKPTHEKALELREMISKRQLGEATSVFPRV